MDHRAPLRDELPLPTIEFEGFELFGVLALLNVLLPGDASSLRVPLFCPESKQVNAYERRPALIGPENGPWLWEVPNSRRRFGRSAHSPKTPSGTTKLSTNG
jgi:hypothetical protein